MTKYFLYKYDKLDVGAGISRPYKMRIQDIGLLFFYPIFSVFDYKVLPEI